MTLLLYIQHDFCHWLKDTKIKIYCYLGYHEWRATGILKCGGFDHLMRCVHCREETWFDECAYQERKGAEELK